MREIRLRLPARIEDYEEAILSAIQSAQYRLYGDDKARLEELVSAFRAPPASGTGS